MFIPKIDYTALGTGFCFIIITAAKQCLIATVTQQGMDAVKNQLYNPLKNLAFGGLLSGANFIAAGNIEGVYVNTDFKGWKLKSKQAAKHIRLHCNCIQSR